MAERTIEQRVDSLETTFNAFMREMSEFKQEMRDFKTEMRDRDNQRAEDIRELRQKQDAAQAKHDADMKELRQKHDADIKEMNAKIDASLQTFTQQLHTNFVQTMMGVGAIMAAIGGLIIAALK
ncbi:MAG: hypothetical protein IKN27_13205 [Selenomonadaceae bacterium]|nr:hypothetical protein [Selenomonadaceae bacterium]